MLFKSIKVTHLEKQLRVKNGPPPRLPAPEDRKAEEEEDGGLLLLLFFDLLVEYKPCGRISEYFGCK